MSNYPPGQTNDQGLITFVGDYINRDVPLWLSVFGPIDGPGNVQVSSITVNASGLVNLQASTIQTVPFPLTEYAPVIFDRGVTDITTYDTSLKMNVSNNVQGITPDEPFLSVTRENGVRYDDLALNSLQIFGNDFTDPSINNGCVGYLTGTGNAVTLRTNAGGNFNTSTINVGTLNANAANISTLNVSSLSANSITATTFISSSTAVSQNLTTATANISTANISTANISTASISSLTASRARVVGNVLADQFFMNDTGVEATSKFALLTQTITPGAGGVNMVAPGPNSLIRIFTGATDAISPAGSNLAFQITAQGSVSMQRDLTVSTIATNQVATTIGNASTINTNLISTGSIRTAAISISTINFRPSISPSVDLGLGGAIGGLIGGASANGFNTLLGTAALGTGIAGLTLPRTSGGLNPGNFQTVAGTSQIQFSTLGAPNTFSQSTPTAFLTTTNGVGVYGSTISSFTTLKAGSWAFRTASDPLNLATEPSTIGATSTIQAVGQWNKVFPGDVSMDAGNRITSLRTQNFISFGGASGDAFRIDTNFPTANGDLPASDPNIRINPIGAIVVEGGGRISVPALEGVSSINGFAFPASVGVPVGSMLMWPVGGYGLSPNVPSGYLLCDGSLQSSSTYPALSALLGNSWNPGYPAANPAGQFYLPMTFGRMPIGGIPSTPYAEAQFQGTVTITLPDSTTRLGARFNNIRRMGTNTPAQLYKGMQPFSPAGAGIITAIFSATLSSAGGWNDDVYLLFDTAWPGGLPGPGAYFMFQNAITTDIPVVGLTNPSGSGNSYGRPYRVQQTTEVGVHTHNALVSSSGNSTAGTTRSEPNPTGATTSPNGQYQIAGNNVAEAFAQNPPNFGVNYIIKAL